MPDNITFEQPMTFNKEIVMPQFVDVATLNAYVPARAGALANVSDAIYKYTSTGWVEMNDANSSGATLRGDVPQTV